MRRPDGDAVIINLDSFIHCVFVLVLYMNYDINFCAYLNVLDPIVKKK